jgi:hypothetical protein
MTDREKLEAAYVICAENPRRSFQIAASALEVAIACLPPDPPQPQGGKEVRIAVAINAEDQTNIMAAADLIYDDDDECIEHVRSEAGDPVTHFAIVTAIIPPISVPTVTGKVETP